MVRRSRDGAPVLPGVRGDSRRDWSADRSARATVALQGRRTPAMSPPPSAPTAGPSANLAPYADSTDRMRFLAEVDRHNRVLETKAGVLLLLIGAVVGWIPVIGLVGGLLTLSGAVLMFFGRRVFHPAHARNVVASVLLLLLGILVGFLIAFFLALTLVQFAGVKEEPALFLAALVLPVVAAAIPGLSRVFFTYALQGTRGRVLLWAAYCSNLAIDLGIAIVVGARVGAASLAALQAQLESLSLLSAIPSGLFAVAYGLAYVSTVRGERPPSSAA